MPEVPTSNPAEAFATEGAQDQRLEGKRKPDAIADLPSPLDAEKKLEAARTQRILEATGMLKRYAQLLTPQEMRTLNINVETEQTGGARLMNDDAAPPTRRHEWPRNIRSFPTRGSTRPTN